jgi:hypothetical protein
MRDEIYRMSNARGPAASLVRTRNAIYAYKDLTDILLHLATAPQTKSVPYDPQESQPAGNLEALFGNVLREFKLAQFEAARPAGTRTALRVWRRPCQRRAPGCNDEHSLLARAQSPRGQNGNGEYGLG